MMEILLLVLLAAGFIIIMWDSVTELAFLCRERLKRWSIGFREESKDQRQIKKSKGMLEGRLYDHICFLLQLFFLRKKSMLSAAMTILKIRRNEIPLTMPSLGTMRLKSISQGFKM